jgi:signal transduction histidine kinase/ligand-binding sensor domain-containing protein
MPRLLAWLAVCLPLWAATSEMPEPRLRIQAWDAASGLPQDSVYALAQTTDGFLWIGTGNGLARFDGVTFEVFNQQRTPQLPVNYIQTLAAAKDGSLWIGSAGGGVTVWQSGAFTNWRVKDGLSSDLIMSVGVDDTGRAWAGSNKGIDVLEHGRWTHLSGDWGLTGAVPYLVSDGEHGMWVCFTSGLAHWRNGKVETFRMASADQQLTSAYLDRDGAVWAATLAGKLFVLREGKFEQQPAEWSGNRGVQGFARDGAGRLWLGSFGGGLAQWRGQRLAVLGDAAGWTARTVFALSTDREDNLWVGTNVGLHRVRPYRFAVLTKADGLRGGLVRAVYQDPDGALWVGTDSAMHRFEGGRLQPLRDSPPGKYAFLSALRTKSGMLFGTAGAGVVDSAYRPAFAAPELGKTFVAGLLPMPDGRLWVATNNVGVRVMEQGRIAGTIGPAAGLAGANVRSLLAASDGSYWVGTLSGIAHGRPGRWTKYTSANGLPSDLVMTLHEDGAHRIWAGTVDGLAYFAGERFVPVGVAQGLPAGAVYSILEDGRQDFWMGTGVGIVHLTRGEVDRLARDAAARVDPVVYGRESGMPSAQCSSGTMNVACRLQGGDLLFGTVDGVVWVRPSAIQRNSLPPTVSVQDALIDGTQSLTGGRLTIPPGARMTEIHFTAPVLSAPEKAAFRYKLEGFDPDWVQAGARRVAYYTNLPSGEYRFLAMARNEDGVWSASPAELPVVARPHFWFTWWFALTVAAGCVALGVLAYRLRIRRLQQEFAAVLAERGRIARELHDTMVQGYVGIGSQLDAVAQELTGSPHLAAMHLTMARRMAQHSMTEARRAVTDLRADGAGPVRLKQAVEQAVSPLQDRFAARVLLRIPGDLPKLPESAQMQLVRIAQEAVTNALQHGAAKEVDVEGKVGDGVLELTIRDAGKGFDAAGAFSTMNGHFGLIGMRERARLAGGSLIVESAKEAGTTVRVTLPLGKAGS